MGWTPLKPTISSVCIKQKLHSNSNKTCITVQISRKRHKHSHAQCPPTQNNHWNAYSIGIEWHSTTKFDDDAERIRYFYIRCCECRWTQMIVNEQFDLVAEKWDCCGAVWRECVTKHFEHLCCGSKSLSFRITLLVLCCGVCVCALIGFGRA